jgi:uncharacterized repeat protein (TIGR03803 family)
LASQTALVLTLIVVATNFHEFTGGADGQLTMDAAGNLYGTTYDGGDPTCPMYGCGVVFEITP